MKARISIVVCAIAALIFAAPVKAQSADTIRKPVALIADEIEFNDQTGVLTAKGSVEVFQGERTLTASAIRYDSRSGRIAASGPVTIRNEGGELLFADEAELDDDLRDALAQGARSVIAGNGKFAAASAERREGRYNILEKAVYSPCEACAGSPTPLWRIRANRIIHDQQEQVIHYEDAYFDLMGVPVGYLPYFRHPSPEVKRATGFLAPSYEQDESFGFGLKTPYYFVIDDYSDFTFTPFLLSNDGALVETEYRRRFERGFLDLDLKSGVTDYGDADGSDFRLGGFGSGRYLVDEGVHAGFDLAFALDDPFLRRYNFSSQDRLTSEAFLRSYDGRNRASLSTAYLQSIRDDEPQDEIPLVLPQLSLRQVWDAPVVGGEAALTLDTAALVREDGRDVGRVSVGADWSRQQITDVGLVLRGFADMRADFYQIGDDPAYSDNAQRFIPRVGGEIRAPFMRSAEDGSFDIFEPIIQMSFAPDVRNGDIPNEDSVVLELDEMNLFETNRFTGFDRSETGANLTVGGRYEHVSESGPGFRVSGGRVIRVADRMNFPGKSGLGGDLSDYVGGASATWDDWLEIGARGQFSGQFHTTRAEAGGRLNFERFSLYGYYLFIDDDPAEDSFRNRSEVRIGGSLQLDRNWKISANTRRDLVEDRFVNAGGVLTYANECAALDFYFDRDFTESINDPKGFALGLSFRLFGSGGAEDSKASGLCAYGAQ